MKRIKLCTRTASSLMLVAGLGLALSPRSVEATITSANYTFENLSTGTLSNQDGWVSIVSGSVGAQVATGTGVDSTLVATVPTGGGRTAIKRQNDGNFSFPAMPVSPDVIFQADLHVLDANESVGWGIGLFTVGQVGFRFYDNGGSQIEYDRGDVSQVLPSLNLPGRGGAVTDWLRVRVTANFGANTAVLSYEDLTLGDTSFTTLAGPFPFLSGGPAPSQWNDMFLDLSVLGGTGGTQADNFLVEIVPEPSSVLLILAGGMLLWRRQRRSSGVME